MNTEDRLIELAEKAPQPWTVWEYSHGGGRISVNPDTDHRKLVADLYEGSRDYVSACDPATIAKLCRVVQAAREWERATFVESTEELRLANALYALDGEQP